MTTREALLAVTPNGTVRWRVVPPARPRGPRWSPDGFRLAYLAGRSCASSSATAPTTGSSSATPATSRPRSGRLPPARRLGRRRRARPPRRRRPRRARMALRRPRPARHPHALLVGRRHARAGRRRPQRDRVRAGHRRRPHHAHPAAPAAAAFPPAGNGAPALLEHRDGQSAIRLLGRRKPLIETSGRYRGLVWSPDGRWLFTRWGSQWLLVRKDGRRVTTLEGPRSSARLGQVTAGRRKPGEPAAPDRCSSSAASARRIARSDPPRQSASDMRAATPFASVSSRPAAWSFAARPARAPL